MDFLNQTPFAVAVLPSRLGFPAHSLTVIVKATFDLVAGGVMTPAEEQALPTGDTPFEDDEEGSGSLYYGSDFAPFKPRADLMFVGSAHAPGGTPVTDFKARFRVGDTKSTVSVIADRYWEPDGSGLLDRTHLPFARLPLRYEHAFGGAGWAANPVGKGARQSDDAVAADDDGPLPLPNIERLDHPVRHPDHAPVPAGFGPLRAEWAPRNGYLGTYDDAWLERRWPWFPEDFDTSYFQAAPADLQVDGYLAGDEWMRLVHLHPSESDLRCGLPAMRVRCFLSERALPPATVVSKRGPATPDDDEKTVLLKNRGKPADDDKTVLLGKDAGTEDDEKTLRLANRDRRLGTADAPRRVGATPVAPSPATDAGDADDEKTVFLGDARGRVNSETGGPQFREVPMVLDTVWVDGDASRAVLVWRGHVPVSSEEFPEVRRAFIVCEPMEQPPRSLRRWHRKYREARAAERGETELPPVDQPEPETPEAAPLLSAEDEARIDAELRSQGYDEATRKAAIEMLTLTPAQQQARAKAEVRAAYVAARVDPDNPPELDVEQQAEKDRLLREWGFDPEQVALAEKGQAPEPEAAGPAEPLDREQVLARLAAGEGLAGQVLGGLDLTGVDFGGADCTGADCRGTDFKGARLGGAILSEARFAGADLRSTDLRGVNAAGADFADATMTGANLAGADLSDASLTGARLTGAILDDAVAVNAVFAKTAMQKVQAQRADFSGADLSRARLRKAVFDGADLSRARLHWASFRRASLKDANLSGAHGQHVDLSRTNMEGLRASGPTRLPGARLSECHAPGSQWRGVDLSDADLSHGVFTRSDFSKARLSGANLGAADMPHARLVGADLHEARLVDVNLFQGSLEKADLSDADLSGANLYEVEFLDALIEETVATRSNLKRTKLEHW